MSLKPEEHIMFAGRDWVVIKAFLLEQRDTKIGMLVSAVDHDKSNQIRGALAMIQTLLALENAANRPQLGTDNGRVY